MRDVDIANCLHDFKGAVVLHEDGQRRKVEARDKGLREVTEKVVEAKDLCDPGEDLLEEDATVEDARNDVSFQPASGRRSRIGAFCVHPSVVTGYAKRTGMVQISQELFRNLSCRTGPPRAERLLRDV
jgi:hypothetical protein